MKFTPPSTYNQIRTRLSFHHSLSITLLVLAANTVWVGVCLSLVRHPNPLIWIPASGLFSIGMFQAFALVHEAGHGNCHSSRWVNVIIGSLSSLICLMPYFTWKIVHDQHHQWTGNLDCDPTLAGVKKYTEQPAARPLFNLIWKTWLPLLALAQHGILYTYPLKARGKKERIQCALSTALILFVHAILITKVNYPFARLWVAAVAYLVLTEMINFPHHLGARWVRGTQQLNVREQETVTRTCYFPPLLGEVLALNFNFHVEHHLFPRLPWYQLRKAHRLLREHGGGFHEVHSGFHWNFENRRKHASQVFMSGEDGNFPARRRVS